MDSSDARNPRAKRASRPKVKTGCNNCKSRRVKCDETRPQCKKCVRANRVCDGYPAHRRSGEIAVPIAPRPRASSDETLSDSPNSSPASSSSGASSSPRSTSMTTATVAKLIQRARPSPAHSHILAQVSQSAALSPTLHVPGGYAFDVREGQYFQVFRTRTAGELSGFFDSDFWTRSVLQESHWEASIRHAVVALGALYKTLEAASESPPGSPQSHYIADSAQDHYYFALMKYGEAIKRLRESLQNKEAQSERTVLISIVLFTCFQSFTGDHRAAIFQIQSGLRLLEERRQESTHPPNDRREGDDELVQMFTRLAIQAKSYDMAFHFPPPYVIQPTPRPNHRQNPSSPQSPSSFQSDAASTASLDSQIPDQFTTSQEARSSLDSLMERMLRFSEALSSFYAGPNNILPSSITHHGLGYRTQLQQWDSAFDPLLQNRNAQGVSNTEHAGIAVLKMIHIMTSVLFLMNFSLSELDFDGFVPQFRQLVELAEEVVFKEEVTLAEARCGDSSDCRHRRANGRIERQFPGMVTNGYKGGGSYSHIKASFALDLGIVPPLFVVATKCRDRKLRREAIALLMSSPRREGMWDSLLCGKVGEWIMEVEEEGMQDFDPSDPVSASEMVPEDKRVMVKEILFDLQRREATLRCGTRGARDGDVDSRARETNILW